MVLNKGPGKLGPRPNPRKDGIFEISFPKPFLSVPFSLFQYSLCPNHAIFVEIHPPYNFYINIKMMRTKYRLKNIFISFNVSITWLSKQVILNVTMCQDHLWGLFNLAFKGPDTNSMGPSSGLQFAYLTSSSNASGQVTHYFKTLTVNQLSPDCVTIFYPQYFSSLLQARVKVCERLGLRI